MTKPKTSRRNQNTSHQKPNTSRQKQYYSRQNQSYFAFAVKYLVLPWGFWFCREVFCFCREGFGFAVRYFVFAVRVLVLPWGILFLRWGFWFWHDVFVSAVRFLVLPWRVSCGPPYGSHHEFTNNNFAFHKSQKQFFTLSRFTNNRGHTKCQKRCIPFCKTVSASIRLLKFFKPINSQREASCRWVWAHWSVKFHQKIQKWTLTKPPFMLRLFGQINDLISSIYFQCTYTQTRILAVQEFHGDHFNHDSQDSFSVNHDWRTPKMVDTTYGVTKVSLPSIPPPPPPPTIYILNRLICSIRTRSENNGRFEDAQL